LQSLEQFQQGQRRFAHGQSTNSCRHLRFGGRAGKTQVVFEKTEVALIDSVNRG
jgi:hypothetical protein